jgi:hypothetical protein
MFNGLHLHALDFLAGQNVASMERYFRSRDGLAVEGVRLLRMRMEKTIQQSIRRTPVGVIVPALFQDLSSPAMQHIIDELSSMGFVKRVYVSLDRASEEELKEGVKFTELEQKIFSELPNNLFLAGLDENKFNIIKKLNQTQNC